MEEGRSEGARGHEAPDFNSLHVRASASVPDPEEGEIGSEANGRTGYLRDGECAGAGEGEGEKKEPANPFMGNSAPPAGRYDPTFGGLLKNYDPDPFMGRMAEMKVTGTHVRLFDLCTESGRKEYEDLYTGLFQQVQSGKAFVTECRKDLVSGPEGQRWTALVEWKDVEMPSR